MPSTTNYGWTLPVPDGSSGTWDDLLNAALDDVDADLHTVQLTADAALPTTGGTLTGSLIGTTATMSGAIQGASLLATAGFGCNSKTAQTAYTLGASPTISSGAYGFATNADHLSFIAQVLSIRAALIANGICSA